MRVQVLHNMKRDAEGRHTAWMDGYRPGDPMTHVFDLELTDVESADGWEDVVSRLLNVGDDPAFGTPDPRALDYRARRNRSLCVGDVLLVAGGTGRAVGGWDWKPVRVAPSQVRQIPDHGTTPLTPAQG